MSLNLKKHSIAALGLATIFVGATIAEAGLTGGSRLRPGSGFHNRYNGSRPSYSPSWGQQRYYAPRVYQSTPRYTVPTSPQNMAPTTGTVPVYHSTPGTVSQPRQVVPRGIYRP